MKRKRIFITGGAGFIGANLVKHLLDKGGYDITVYDNFSTGSKTNLMNAIKDSRQRGETKIVEGDILDSAKLNRLLKHYNAIIHLAAHTRVVESVKNPREGFTVNSIGTFNVFEAARINRIKIVVFASSNAACGEQIPPINENMIPSPISPYGASKLYGEALCSAYSSSYGLNAISLRFANAYGSYSEHKTSVIAKFIKSIKQGKPLLIYGDGNQTRDLIHATDICKAICLALKYKNPYSKAQKPSVKALFQVASGKETKIKDLAEMIASLAVTSADSRPAIRFTDSQPGEIKKNFSDTRKARKFLHYESSVVLDDGLKRTWEWFDR